MKPFLTTVFEEVEIEKYSKTTFIFPTQRAISLFKNEIFRQYNKPIELPSICTWTEFIDTQIPNRVIDKDEAITLLYHVYSKNNKQAESFAGFLNWGETVFEDFERIHLNNLSGEKVLDQVNIIKTLEKWDLDISNKSSYLKIWEKLPKIFKEFYQFVLDNNLSTGALKYQIGCNEIKKNSSKKRDLVFCGFTVFSPAEQEIIKELAKNNQVSLIEDSPIWNGIDKNHESNRFRKENEALFSKVIHVNAEDKQDRLLESIECGNNVVAAKTVSKLLGEIPVNELNKTAVVLLDDSDLPLLVNSIPESIKSVNIGKGKTFLNTHEGTFFQSLLKIHKELKRKNEITFPLVFELLDLLKPFQLVDLDIIDQIRENILRKNLRLLNREQFSSVFSNTGLKSLHHLFKIELGFRNFVHKLLELKEFSWTGACHSIVLRTLDKCRLLSGEIDYNEAFHFLFENEFKSTAVAIRGDKKSGLQILSLLETRCLDFEHLIFLSFTDENLPQSNQVSLLPLELRIQYQLPDQAARESILAYHFMRLIKRSPDTKFIYASGSSFAKSGDPSRFLLQAKMEWSRGDSRLKIVSSVVKNELSPFVSKELSIEKSDQVHDAIKHYLFVRGISPSAINVYLSNPMDFLLYHVLGLREKENVDLIVETSTLGTVIHDTLEKLYKPYLEKGSNEIVFGKLGSQIVGQLEFELSKIYPKSYLENGRLKILQPVLEKWIKNFLALDKKRGELQPFKILGVEQKLEYSVPGVSIPLKMKGIVDRVESWKDAEHVIDYKTGKVDQRDLKISSEELINFNPDKSKAYQLLMYTYIYRGVNVGTNSLLSSIYSFRNQKSGFLPLLIDGNEIIGENELAQFEKGIVGIAKQMLDKNIPIELTNHRYQKFSI